MRCPQCNQWNRATLPRCIRCGADLPQDAAAPEWMSRLKTDRKAYIRVDEDGDVDETPDQREVLAAEMAELKARKNDGEALQQRLRDDAAQREAASGSVSYAGYSVTDPFLTAVSESDADDAYMQEADEEIVQDEEALPRDEAPVPQTTMRNPRGTRVILSPEQWHDTRACDPLVEEMQQNAFLTPPMLKDLPPMPRRRTALQRTIRLFSTILLLGVSALILYFGYSAFTVYQANRSARNAASVTASILDELAAHTILIPGEDGQQIYIKELHNTYEVIGGFATIEIADYTWYSDLPEINSETMSVTLTPYMKTASGRQQPMDLITYDITIPKSDITLLSPENLRTEVTTAMYSIRLNVRPGSLVTINGEDVSDTVNEAGELTYNATVQPIGDNRYDVVVRSPYCRDNTLSVVLYREKQEIPLDLAATTYTSTSLQVLPISATTLPGAEIDVLSPHSDLLITDLDTTGAFSFNAIFDHIGNNTITITASYPGKKTSRVDYTIYYLPSADVYTPKAWSLNNPSDYAELLGNITVRAERTQIYVAMGVIDHFVSEKPQMAVVYCSNDGQGQPVLLENQSKTTWKVGEYYRIYCDAYSTYNGMPWLIARYTYR